MAGTPPSPGGQSPAGTRAGGGEAEGCWGRAPQLPRGAAGLVPEPAPGGTREGSPRGGHKPRRLPALPFGRDGEVSQITYRSVMDWTVSPQTPLTPVPLNVTLTGHRVTADVIG